MYVYVLKSKQLHTTLIDDNYVEVYFKFGELAVFEFEFTNQ